MICGRTEPPLNDLRGIEWILLDNADSDRLASCGDPDTLGSPIPEQIRRLAAGRNAAEFHLRDLGIY